MMLDDIARRYDRRSGFDLIDYAHVALPLYRLTIDSVTMVHRDLMPINEFTMKAIDAGLQETSEIADFLGLDHKTVSATLSDLRDSAYIVVSEDESRADLLPRGKQVLADARENVPQDEMLTFMYDRLLRKPVEVSVEQLMYPAEVDPQTTIEIRPYPVEGPEIADLLLSEVQRTLTTRFGRKSFGRDILRLRRIVRRARMFRRAVGLLYKRPRTSEVQLAFVIDGVGEQEIEQAFALAGGPKKMGFIQLIDESVTSTQLRRHLGPDVTRLLPDTNSMEEERRQVSLARFKVQSLKARIERQDNNNNNNQEVVSAVQPNAMSAALAVLENAESKLRTVAARPVRLFEASEMMWEALERSKNFLSISSKSASPHIVSAEFISALTSALKRGVMARIGLSLFDPNELPVIELERLRRDFRDLILESGRATNFFHVISDSQFAVVCNRPFLSNAAKVRQFGHFSGFALFSENLVEAYKRRITRFPRDP